MNDNHSSESNRIRALRNQLNLSQKEIADQTGIARTYWSALETGRRELTSTIVRSIAHKFNVSPDWLLSGNGDMFMIGGSKMADSIITKQAILRDWFDNLMQIIELDEKQFGEDPIYEPYLEKVTELVVDLTKDSPKGLTFDEKASLLHDINEIIPKFQADFIELFGEFYRNMNSPRRRKKGVNLPRHLVNN